ncbi:MAG: S41 family peptidase [bacterium]|nr:S41 family peptidase [bacterium]MDZ4296184.1 S41 family peptidase [Patescibacteria group bacterium]
MDSINRTTEPSDDTRLKGPRRSMPWGSTLVPLFVAGAFLFGLFLGRESVAQPILPPEGVIGTEIGRPGDVDASILWDVWQRVEAKYVDKEEIDRQKLLYGAAEGIVRALGDPYSVFLPPQEAKRFEDDVRGAFDGIGAEIGIRKETLTIIAPIEGSPAQRAGLLAGDKVLKIDDETTADLTLDEAVNLIRGPRGTEVTLAILREGSDESREVKIKRDVIKIPVISWELKEGDVAWIKMHHFTESLTPEFHRVTREIRDRRPKGIVLDLRNNPGGFLEVSVDIAGAFLGLDQLVVVEAFGDGRRQEYRTSGSQAFKETPLVVLINGGSASAAEILAGALRDQRGTQLVGEQSYGKGSVQELETLRGGASLKITVAKWVTPAGVVLSDGGLEPDVVIERTSEDFEANRDPQLDKAIELLR